MLEVVRAARSESRRVSVRAGAPLRSAIRAAGLACEGVLVLDGETPVPLDLPVRSAGRFRVVPTFSGG